MSEQPSMGINVIAPLSITFSREILIPTVQYGNQKLSMSITLTGDNKTQLAGEAMAFVNGHLYAQVNDLLTKLGKDGKKHGVA